MMRMFSNRSAQYALAAVLSVVASAPTASAQTPAPQVTLPPVTVTAQKEPADPQQLPVSVSVVPLESLWNGGMTTLGDASIYAPNTYFTDFTARKLSTPRFRGIGSSPANPAMCITSVSEGGLEPPRPCGHQPLKMIVGVFRGPR